MPTGVPINAPSRRTSSGLPIDHLWTQVSAWVDHAAGGAWAARVQLKLANPTRGGTVLPAPGMGFEYALHSLQAHTTVKATQIISLYNLSVAGTPILKFGATLGSASLYFGFPGRRCGDNLSLWAVGDGVSNDGIVLDFEFYLVPLKT